MAKIRELRPASADRTTVHRETDCGWRSFSMDGIKILQLDTYGSDNRAIAGKVSQSIQMNETIARQLVQVIRSTFPGI